MIYGLKTSILSKKKNISDFCYHFKLENTEKIVAILTNNF